MTKIWVLGLDCYCITDRETREDIDVMIPKALVDVMQKKNTEKTTCGWMRTRMNECVCEHRRKKINCPWRPEIELSGMEA